MRQASRHESVWHQNLNKEEEQKNVNSRKAITKAKLPLGITYSILGIIALVAIACGPAAQPSGNEGGETQPIATSAPSGQTAPTQAPSNGQDSGMYASLSGDISIDGSSTVFPITEAVAEEFGKLTGGKVRVTVGISGTGGGFKKFCNSETQISDASRPIKASEAELCAQAGIEYIEIPVAIDGLSVMVNPQNDFVECMTVEELNKIWAPEAEGVITKWNQVRPEWPDEDIELFGAGVDSGTFDYFTEVINGESQASRGDFTASENDNVLVQGIAGDRNSLGFFGYAYYVENQEKLKIVAIDGGNGCVTPTPETINNGTYIPLSRPIFIYVRQDAADTPYVKGFVEYYLSQEGGQQLTAEVGYIPFPTEVYDLALKKFQNGTTGAVFGGENPMQGTVAEVLRASS
jgi:phosphate transport system substrate-binding protein